MNLFTEAKEKKKERKKMKPNRRVKILIGIPGSGKSTWTKEFIMKNPEWVKISRDDFRFMLRNSPVLDFKGENMVTSMVTESARKALLSGYDVILDNTHCQLRYITSTVESLNDLADIEYMYFDVPLKTCIERDALREKKVGEDVVKKMHKDLTVMLETFDFQPVKKSKRLKIDYAKQWDPALPFAIISDVDGTIAHMNGKRGPFDWKKVGVDDIDQPMIDTLKAWKFYGKFDKESPEVHIIVCSGRDSSCRQETLDWMDAAEVPYDKLFMRPAGDFRKDSLIKEEIYENEIKGKYNVIMVYDDRDQVVTLWRSLGLKCAQVEPGQF